MKHKFKQGDLIKRGNSTLAIVDVISVNRGVAPLTAYLGACGNSWVVYYADRDSILIGSFTLFNLEEEGCK